MSYLSDKRDQLLFLPLGGCGEIGMNLNLYGYAGKWIMVDLGMTFGDPTVPGVDLMFPDIGFIEEEKDDLVALIVTHGHEDHIGAIPYVWERLGCPVYATPFTAALIRDKLEEHGLSGQVPLHIVDIEETLTIGPFEIDYIPIAHSIAEGNGLAIRSKAGTIFHTGDWKVDPDPLIGPVSPEDRLRSLGDEGVLAVVGDSTNIFNPSESGSEADVRTSLIDLATGETGKLVITTFASNIARLETLGEVAKATGRSLVPMGRSMHRMIRIGQETGYFKDFPPIVPEDFAGDLPSDRLLIACTGCQGEHRAALSRIARGDHKSVGLGAGDTVIFSSKIIPGNELELGRLFNDLALANVTVITEKDHFVHVSGHPGQAELRQMFAWTRPKLAVPVHGEARHIQRHAAFAKSCGVPYSIRPVNGDVIRLTDKGAVKIDEVAVGRLALDGQLVTPLGDAAIVDRRRIMVQGIVTVQLTFDPDGALEFDPLISMRGLPRGMDDVFYDEMLDAIETALERMKPRDRRVETRVEEVVRIAVRRLCRSEIGKNPVVDVMISTG